MNLLFEKTCEACPEQYDVRDEKNLLMVGYIRLRWGHLTVTCPDIGGEVVYEATIDESGWGGCFESDLERDLHLTEAKIAIEKWLEKENE